MTSSNDSLLKYDNPVLVSTKNGRRSSPKVVLQSGDFSSAPPSPELKLATSEYTNELNQILTFIQPTREWMEGNELWIQKVSSAPSTRRDVVQLEEQLHRKLKEMNAIETGICPVRREIYAQCFDELIRQVTTSCTKRGFLLLRVRDEIQATIAAYQIQHESTEAFGTRKALQAKLNGVEMEKRITLLETENKDLKKQLMKQKYESEIMAKKALDKYKLEEKIRTEEILFLKTLNQQLQVQLEQLSAFKN